MNPYKTGFLIITISQIPAVCCAIYILLEFARRTSPLRRIQNHLLIYLLILATWTITMELPHMQIYLWTGSASIHTYWFCYLWNVSCLSMASFNRLLMAFMSIERHFLVFHPQLYHTYRSRLILHYIPVSFILIIAFIYFFITNVFVSCPYMYVNYAVLMCGYTCSVLVDNLGLINIVVFVFAPTIITIVSCILLPIRFLIQKRGLQRVQWHRARKLIVQMSMIAGIYSASGLTYAILLQLLSSGILSWYDPSASLFVALGPYITSLLTPFIVLHTVRDQIHLKLVAHIKRRFFPQRQQVVRPVNILRVNRTNHTRFNEKDPTKPQLLNHN